MISGSDSKKGHFIENITKSITHLSEMPEPKAPLPKILG
jgi:hypothetical protein